MPIFVATPSEFGAPSMRTEPERVAVADDAPVKILTAAPSDSTVLPVLRSTAPLPAPLADAAMMPPADVAVAFMIPPVIDMDPDVEKAELPDAMVISPLWVAASPDWTVTMPPASLERATPPDAVVPPEASPDDTLTPPMPLLISTKLPASMPTLPAAPTLELTVMR
jgi:hypothetical protein